MIVEHLTDLSGVTALTLSIRSLLLTSDRALLRTSVWAMALWAVNNLLIGAHAAAALSALGAGRQAGAAALLQRPGRMKAAVYRALMLATVATSLLLWNGPRTLAPLAGALISCYAVFHLRGAALRGAMVVVNLLWMVHALAFGAQWQLAAAALGATAAAAGAWRAGSAVACRAACDDRRPGGDVGCAATCAPAPTALACCGCRA